MGVRRVFLKWEIMCPEGLYFWGRSIYHYWLLLTGKSVRDLGNDTDIIAVEGALKGFGI